jgi:hypothetical protein
MSRKSRLRTKATFRYKPEVEGSIQNPVQHVDPVSTPLVPEKINDTKALPTISSAGQAPQISEKELSRSREKAYRKLSHSFVFEEPKEAALLQAEQIQDAKPKVSSLRFESQLKSSVSVMQFGKLEKDTKAKELRGLPIRPAPWLRTHLKEDTNHQENHNVGIDALQAGERSAYSLQSQMRLPQAKSSTRSITSIRRLQIRSLRQQAEAFASENLKTKPIRNPVLRYIQKQRIKREYFKGYRAAARLRSTAARQRTAQGAKKIFSKLIQVFKNRATLYASIALVLLLLTGSLASFAVSATTVMGGNIIGGLGESLRGSEGMVEVARSQLGQVGGEPYWSWYGFPSRVEWCAIFVSWVADQNGLISDGRFPKFAGCSVGESWFRSADAWQERGYQPSPGEVIFFDWNGDGIPDHVGIVESSDGSTDYTKN